MNRFRTSLLKEWEKADQIIIDWLVTTSYKATGFEVSFMDCMDKDWQSATIVSSLEEAIKFASMLMLENNIIKVHKGYLVFSLYHLGEILYQNHDAIQWFLEKEDKDV